MQSLLGVSQSHFPCPMWLRMLRHFFSYIIGLLIAALCAYA